MPGVAGGQAAVRHRGAGKGEDRGAEVRDGQGGVTLRAVLLGSALVLVLSRVSFQVSLRFFTSSAFSTGVPACAPYATLFLFTALMSVRWVKARVGFSRRELLTVYAVMLAGVPLVSQGILGWMLPHSIVQFYLARATPEWEPAFLHLVPTWFTPTEREAVESFFLGRSAVPWAVWWTPLAAWGSFLVALVIASTCLVTLVARQWITHERLSFPLVQLPLHSVGADRGSTGRLPIGWPFWLGMLISFGIGSFNNLGFWFPALPSVPIGPVTLIPWQKVGPAAGLGDIDLVLYPWEIGLAYLLPKDLSFSVWFFWWFRLALTVLAITAGATPQRPDEWFGSSFPAPYWLGVGAMVALAAWTAWTARRHLGRALRIAFCGNSGGPKGEAVGLYRGALVGLTCSGAWLVYFCWLAGSRVMVAVGLIGLILVFYLVWARLRAETGMGFLSFPLKADSVLLTPLGSAFFRPAEVVTIISARWAYFPGYGQSLEVVPGNTLESLKLAEAAGVPWRRLLGGMGIGFLVALVAGLYMMMTGIYHYGFYGLKVGTTDDWWLYQQLRGDGERIFQGLASAAPGDPAAALAMGSGAAFTLLLGLMRQRFWWWPFHPIGFLAANTWGIKWDWMPIFVGWMLKSLAIRYGGLGLYRSTVPAAIGLIGGDLLNQAIWGVVRAIAMAGT